MVRRIIRTGLLLCALIMLSACGNDKKPVPSVTPGGIIAADPQFAGIIKSIDAQSGVVVFQDNNYGTDISLLVSDSTSVYSVNNALTTSDSLESGMLVQAVYDGTTMLAKTIQPVPGAWSYEDIINWSVDSDNNIMKIADTNYQFLSDIVVISGGKPQDMMCLNGMDELKVYGIDRRIYSIIVEKGHGYIRPENYKDFVGGMASVGYLMNQPVTEDMLMVVREGTYDVTMRNGDLTGTKTVDVRRDEETVLDMIEFRQNPKDVGKVGFVISPSGAELYINGRQTDYGEEVLLNYGEHEVVVSLMGYSTYAGKLKVSSPNPTVKINLTEETADIDEATQSPAASATSAASVPTASAPATGTEPAAAVTAGPTAAADSTTSTGDESRIVYDKNHTITIDAPTGAEVYLNGTYKGIAPCSFPKQIGSQTVTLSKSGYATKSYSIPIADDSKDITWSFQELVPE